MIPKKYKTMIADALTRASYRTKNGMIDLSNDLDLFIVVEELRKEFSEDIIQKALFIEISQNDDDYTNIGGSGYVLTKALPDDWDQEKDGIPSDAQRFTKGKDGKYSSSGKEKKVKATSQALSPQDFPEMGDEGKPDVDPKQVEKDKKKAEKLERETEAKKEVVKTETSGTLDQVAWENDTDQEEFQTAFDKLVNGEELTEEELAMINKYAAVKDSDSEAALYLPNQTPGDFRQGARVKVELGGSAAAKRVLAQMVENGIQTADPVTTAESVPAKLKTKDATLGKISGGKTKSHTITTEKDKDGRVISVTVAGKVMRRQLEPDADVLIKEVVEMIDQGKSPEDAAREAQKILAGIKRYNNLIDKYASADPAVMETVELVPGADVSTPEGRNRVASEGPGIVADALEKMIDDPTEAERKVLDRIRKLGDIEDAEEYEREAMAILKRMGEISSIKKGAPDVAEALVLCAMNKKGIPTVAPAGETFKVADLIQLAEEDLDPTDPEYLQKLAAGGPVVVFMTTAGGLSVKKDGGAASGFEAKLGMTTFKLPETKNMLTAILDHHNHGIATTKKGEELSPTRIATAKKKLDEVEKWARENDLVDDNDLKFKDGRSPEEWATDSVADWQAKGTLPPDCPTKNAKGECLSDDNKKNLIDGLHQYARGGLLAQAIHNNDLDFQDYHNANANTRTGEIELSDGIECLNDMQFSANPGFKMKKDKNGNFIMRPNAVYAGNLHKRCR